MPKPRTAAQAGKAVQVATEAVIQQGDAVIEDALWDAHEAALDGASPEVLVETISGMREGPYVPSSGRVRGRR